MEKPRVLIIPLASVAVDRENIKNLLNDFIQKIQEYNSSKIGISLFEIVDERNISDMLIKRIDNELINHHGLLLLHLTGGTSKISVEILTNISNVKPFALLAHKYFNSLNLSLIHI